MDCGDVEDDVKEDDDDYKDEDDTDNEKASDSITPVWFVISL